MKEKATKRKYDEQEGVLVQNGVIGSAELTIYDAKKIINALHCKNCGKLRNGMG